ncbi:MAG: hypothetical protein FP831_08695 [Anaerolineae bacterium]|nr:hypothetical protein [Anaerolineae bacterium]
MKKKQLFYTVILLILFSCYFVVPVQACTPAAPTPWFTEKIEVLTENLPQDISFYQSDWDTGPYSTLWINNNSEKKIQIITKDGKVIQKTTAKQVLFLSDNPNYDDTVCIFESRNILGDNRPENVILPDAQSFEIPIKVEQDYFTLMITVTYKLNETYRSTSVYDFENACSQWYVQTQINSCLQLLPYIFLLASICVIAIIAIRKRRKKKFLNKSYL